MVYPDRPPPPPEDVLWAPWARSIRRAQAPRFPLSMAFVGWVCQGAAGGVFRRFTSSFQVGVEAIIGQKYFWGLQGRERAGQTAGVDGGTSCHGSLLRHASRAIVTSRPLRVARDRQLRRTVPGGRRKANYVLHVLTRCPVTTRSGEFRRKKAESGLEPGHPEDATARRFTRTR